MKYRKMLENYILACDCKIKNKYERLLIRSDSFLFDESYYM